MANRKTRVSSRAARRISAWLIATQACVAGGAATAQPTIRLTQDDLQKRANGVLALMSFSIVPDITTSALSIGGGGGTTGSTEFYMTQLGGGDTISKSVPIYLEGVLAGSRYDPTFVASQGLETRKIPTKWNSVSATGGSVGTSSLPMN